MKRTIIVLVLFVAICSVLYAQRPNSNLPSGAFIEIDNVKLRLGMSKSEVAEKLVGTSLKKLNEDLWVIGKGPSPSMQFTNGHLTFADRTWSVSDDDIAESLFGVVSSFNSEGYSSCEVTANTDTSPNMTHQNVWINCGEKKILVKCLSMDGKTYKWVSEQLGVFRDISN
jgi:hypothetical protein